MKTTYVIGHKKPDTDTVCSAISYSYLKNKLGWKTEPRVLGNINKETEYALKYFNVKEPAYVNDVKVQIKDMKYLSGAMVNIHASMENTFNRLQSLGVTGLPLVDDDNKLKGYVNVKEMAKNIIEGDIYELNTSYDNILDVLNATSILRFDELIQGKIIAAAYKSQTFTTTVKLSNENVLIVADRRPILEYALNCNVKLIIMVGNNAFPEDLIPLATEKKINIIKTPFTTFLTANKMKLCNFINTININENPIKFTNQDYRDDFVDIATKYGHTNYPIVDNENNCLGMLRLIDQNNYEKRNLILVDHNQVVQSVDGIEEADILEIIDHHNLGAIGTNVPINFRSKPVGCTSTMIYDMFLEKKISIPKDIAGLMLSAILSDTLLLTSPTTTEDDRFAAVKLATIAKVDIDKYGLEMIKAASSIEGMSVRDLIKSDFKNYVVGTKTLGIGQVMTLDFDKIKENMDEYVHVLDEMVDTNYNVVVIFITDIIKNGSYVIYNTKAKDIVEDGFGLKDTYEGVYIPKVVSRKKQILPSILSVMEDKK